MLPVLRHRSLQFIFLQSSLTELMHFYILGVPTAIIKSDSLPALRGRSFIIHLHQSSVKPYGPIIESDVANLTGLVFYNSSSSIKSQALRNLFIFILNEFLGLLSFQMLPV